MSSLIDDLIAPLTSAGTNQSAGLPVRWREVQGFSAEMFVQLLLALREHAEALDPGLAAHQWQLIFGVLLDWCERRAGCGGSESVPGEIAAFYVRSAELPLPRYQLLTCLSTLREASSIAAFVALMRDDPPLDQTGSTTPFLPLMRPVAVDLWETLFPSLFDSLEHPQLAPAVMDVANFFARQQPDRPHPATNRSKQLIQLLSGVTRQLEVVQSAPWDPDTDATASEPSSAGTPEVVANTIALAISLCDALALIGDRSAVAALGHALELSHRRVRVEAASALARLSDQEGKRVLLELAAEPSVRLRVLSYAEELGIEDEVDEAFTTGAAVAEAELVTFLSSSSQYGLPPSTCELVEATTLYWPGYEEPRNCYLFRFSYHSIDERGGASTFTNLGIAGPVTHAMRADTSQLSPNDAFALFAGWQAEHAQISHRTIDSTSTLDITEQQLREALEEGPYQQVEVCLSGSFFSERVLLAQAIKGGKRGIALVSADGVEWFAETSEVRPLAPEDVFSIYKGRRLLDSFNQ